MATPTKTNKSESKYVEVINSFTKNTFVGIMMNLTGHLRRVNKYKTTKKNSYDIANKIKDLDYRVKTTQNYFPEEQYHSTEQCDSDVKNLSKFTTNDLCNAYSKTKHILEGLTNSNNLETIFKFIYMDDKKRELTDIEKEEGVKLLQRVQQHKGKLFESFTKRIKFCLDNNTTSEKDWKLTGNMIRFWNLFIDECERSADFKKELVEVTKTTMLPHTRRCWLAEIPKVNSNIRSGYKCEFEVMINNVPDEIIEKLQQGPQIANYGKFGRVEFELMSPIELPFDFSSPEYRKNLYIATKPYIIKVGKRFIPKKKGVKTEDKFVVMAKEGEIL